MVTIAAGDLRDLVRDIFVAAGCSREEGARIGKSLVGANLAGHDSHGVVRVPRYLQWMAEGDFIADQTVEVVRETPVLAVIDGRYGFGQTTAPQAVEIGIAKCRAMGLSAVALRNSGHVGRVGEWAEMAAEAGLVSIHFCNAASSLLVAPFGGVDRRLSTAPYAIGVPREGGDPLILDFATSVVAEGKVLVASQGGKKLPPNSLVGPDGTINGDPAVLYGPLEPNGPRDYRQGKGAIRAFGEHKGSGLAFMVELLGGSLTGTGAAQEGRRWANGMLSIYIDPRQLDPEEFFPGDVKRYLEFFKSSRPVEAGGEVLVPGEPEIRTRGRRLAEGVPLPDDTWARIVAAARSVGLDDARIVRAQVR
ncbi:MAG: Ldh family oxidoreductase [Hyphomicrobiaceae bacterium]|nr:Ldh family oxidoreductase [Hyphomicrobiaceae bacterium]